MSDIEILSPAGNLDTLICAVNNGADAVYIGGQSFSARKNAVNFTNDEIVSAIRYAHLYDAKVYVTVNTLIYDSEFTLLFDFIKFLYEAGADALIIQDLGVISMVRKYFPDFELHASTQMTIHNIEGARLAKELGFKRVVLSRELTFAEIKAISENVDIELEVFVHGALCMSYSGQCLMSSFIGGRSGNRGACAQPCRLPYTLMSKDGEVISGKDKYLLSLKDLCLIDEMDMLKKCNVKSLKIEGRMKSADYVSVVTSVYKKYRDGGKVSKEDYDLLKNIFSRNGFTKGYLWGKTGREMLNYERNNDSVYDDITPHVKATAEELKKKVHSPIEFTAHAKILTGRPMELTVCAKGREITLQGTHKAENAVNVPLSEERVVLQLAKSGTTPFKLFEYTLDIDDGVSLPIKEINSLRRDALNLLESELTKSERNYKGEIPDYTKAKAGFSKAKFYAEVKTMEQLFSALSAGFDKILIPYKLYFAKKQEIHKSGCDFAVVLPNVSRDNTQIDFDNIEAEIYASNFSHLSLCNKFTVHANYSLNIFNSFALDFLCKMGVKSACVSPEISIRDIKHLSSPVEKEVIVYGKLPLMTIQNCALKSSVNSCGCGDDYYFLKDRKGAMFPLFSEKGACINTIYNSNPVYMADKLKELEADGLCAYRFVFTTESGADVQKIYNEYVNGYKPDCEFTRGHFYKSI